RMPTSLAFASSCSKPASPTPLRQQRSHSRRLVIERTPKISARVSLGVVLEATIAMPSAPAAIGPAKAAALSQPHGATCLRLPANQHRYGAQREHARRLATE